MRHPTPPSTSTRRSRLARVLWSTPLVVVCALVTGVLSLPSFGCASAPSDGSTRTDPVDPAVFQLYVSPVFERRCGTLDCHGSPARGLRLYGSNGLRLANDNGVVAGEGTTTQAELKANYASVVGFEPEQMALVRKGEADVYSLLILKKPIRDTTAGGERHKGGVALVKGDPAEQCITSWLEGTTKTDLCARGSRQP